MDKLVLQFFRLLLALASVAMLAAFASVSLGVMARLMRWDIPGLDAYAGYAIAAALFLALPGTLVRGEHIRVTLVLDRLPAGWRRGFEWWCLLAGLALSLYTAWYAGQLVWISHLTHDVSPAADATPLWLPQLAMALGCIGLALAFAQAVIWRLSGRELIAADTAARTE
ncbi:MAG: TRAP transporter small permease subunit [Hydrogenophaga sp.]|uniref:TRAP transporter small permease n=1 Tax=Hydrogenophaga sp. TaxID=1904254 RepID=UPI001DC522AE|nr:TRAP transporter small permease subunit [Hydrogenophaga sp.]MBX3610891.1 TRAP transporter small permease subunit [Hydrogenophaga sp.]